MMRILSNAPAVTPRWKIDRYFLRGLEQQLWFWGQDVRHGGNLLVRYGFRRFRSSGGAKSSRYRLDLGDGWTVELHAFCVGIYSADAPGFCFIRARRGAYLYDGAEPPDPECFCHAPLILPESEAQYAALDRAAARFLEWLEGYEQWLEALAGSAYRGGLFPHVPLPWLPPAQARAWFAQYAEDAPSAVVPRRRGERAKLRSAQRSGWSRTRGGVTPAPERVSLAAAQAYQQRAR